MPSHVYKAGKGSWASNGEQRELGGGQYDIMFAQRLHGNLAVTPAEALGLFLLNQ